GSTSTRRETAQATGGSRRRRAPSSPGARLTVLVPEPLEHLRVPALAEPDCEQLQAVRARLEAAGDGRGEADGVPLTQLADLVLDLHAAAAPDDDIDFLLRAVPV